MLKSSFLAILYAKQNLKGCVAWALLSKSVGYQLNRNIACSERILFNGFERVNGFPTNNGKNKWVCLICLDGWEYIKNRLVFISKNHFDNSMRWGL